MSDTKKDLEAMAARQPCSLKYDTFLDELAAELDDAGYVIVPKEPTETMIRAAHNDARWGTIQDVYRAMVSAKR